MNEARARAMIQAHFDASNVGAAGGGPGDDIVGASEIYADDAVVEWPQGGERLRGKANIIPGLLMPWAREVIAALRLGTRRARRIGRSDTLLPVPIGRRTSVGPAPA
jgi:hypothetical protein